MNYEANWVAEHKKYGPNVLIVHLEEDDDAVFKLTELASDAGYKCSCDQIAGQAGVTVIVNNIRVLDAYILLEQVGGKDER